MPQMGESITEGTITKWLKKVGDTVQRDEPIFEISTDKVDAEIPSPVAGMLTEIKVPEGATVTHQHRRRRHWRRCWKAAAAPAAAAPAACTCRSRHPQPHLPPLQHPQPQQASASRSSPLVRKIAKENNVDLAQVPGTGSSGRITKTDILGHLEQRPRSQPPRRAAIRPRRPPPPRKPAATSAACPASSSP